MKIKNRYFLRFLFLIVAFSSYSQSDPNNLVFNGNKESIKKNYTRAEVEYRKAISDKKGQSKAAHNLGNILFENENYDEAIQEYFKTQKNSELDLERHSAFHNLGNTYMKKKDYAQAVEAYKNALRSNSEDDETRYNYALAKEFLEGDKRQNSQDNSKSEDEKKDKSEDSAAARATASETPRIEFAPRRLLFFVPSSAIISSSIKRWSCASKPDTAGAISSLTNSTAFKTPLPK